jgi:putative hydrolase of the HAD superfamily
MTDRRHNEVLHRIIATHQATPAVRPSALTPVLTPLSGIRAVLFDVYGTLLLSERNNPGPDGRPDAPTLARLAAFTEKYRIRTEPAALVAAFLELISAVNRAAAAAGRPFPEVNVIHVWSRLLGRRDYDELKRLSLEFEMIVHHCRPAGDLNALFTFLRSRELRLGVVSNAQFYTQLILEYFLGRSLPEAGFDKKLILYSYIYRVAKPAEILFQKVTERLKKRGLLPEHVLFIGDSPVNDIAPARQAGFKTALFSGTDAAVRVLQPAGDAVITDWNQIGRILG